MNQVDKSRVPMYAFVFFAFLMSAVPGEAHLNSTGMGPFYDGLMHFLMSPEDIIPVLALALLAGLRGADFGRRALLVLPCLAVRQFIRSRCRGKGKCPGLRDLVCPLRRIAGCQCQAFG